MAQATPQKTIREVTERIRMRSNDTRTHYLKRIEHAADSSTDRSNLGCSNLAHGIAGCDQSTKDRVADSTSANIAVITAYNDMLSAHQPYESYPNIIRQAAQEAGGSAQVAGGVPAMCDGVTQGRVGMELSLFSRDVIAMGTAVALSHDMYDAALCLGVCDKIVPGLLIGALSYGHIPTVFVPAGPMPSGLPNKDKAAVREAHAAGKADRGQLLAAESAAYHSPGTCTFYGTANSNQMLMEFMGLQLPGSSFEPPGSEMRNAFTRSATRQAMALTKQSKSYTPIGLIVDEKAIVNAMVGLLATGGSTNHTIHLIAIAAAAGIQINWQDLTDLASGVPLIASVYPNGQADINHFHAAGGIGFVIHELLDHDLLHADVSTVVGHGLDRYTKKPNLNQDGSISWQENIEKSADYSVLRSVEKPFQDTGGLTVVEGSIGRAVVKTSAVKAEHHKISAAAKVFRSQDQFLEAFDNGTLNQDLVAVVTHQGPSANGMPELHKLTPALGTLQNQGFKVALLTDGRMSGASGKVLAAIQVSPEAANGGWIGRIQDGDMIQIDTTANIISVDADLESRSDAAPVQANEFAAGVGLFEMFRQKVGSAENGASVFSLGQ